jgi:hypothetical protein
MFDNLEQKNIPEKVKTGPEKWQDFWLPSENNDYHPHSLQFRRMFFYASYCCIDEGDRGCFCGCLAYYRLAYAGYFDPRKQKDSLL